MRPCFRTISAIASLAWPCAAISAQGAVSPFRVGITNPLPGLSAPAVPGGNVQQVHMIHLPTDPANVFHCALTVSGLSGGFGGVGGLDLLTGKYDVLTDTFTPNNEAAALNTTGTEFGLMLHHSGLHAVFDRLPGLPWLASRPALGAPWQIVGQIAGLPTQPYYDPALADFGGQSQLLHVAGTGIAMTPINLANGALLGPGVVVVNQARPGSTANSPTPILDSSNALIGLSHHDVLSSDNDHYLSLDFDPNTPPILLHDATTWRNNGAFVGGRFYDAESTAPYHILAIDNYWFTGGRGPIGGSLDVFAYTPPTTANETWLSFLVIGANFLPSGVPVPPLGGLLGLDLSTMVTVPFPAHNNANGEALLTLPVPNVPFLRGRALPAQSATFRVTTNAFALGNTAQLAFF